MKKRILAISSGGGHWVELLRLCEAFSGHDLALATVGAANRIDAGNARFYTLRDVTRWNKLQWPAAILGLLWVLLRERPDIVVSTGALPGYFALRMASWFGARTIWVDSLANVDELSMSGQMVGKYADLWLTQWRHLATATGPHYRGSVL
jgi:UDP-N-acetylglucosamine:LPS N-acetylglucosamine transferase